MLVTFDPRLEILPATATEATPQELDAYDCFPTKHGSALGPGSCAMVNTNRGDKEPWQT